jgi:hypothetical protein
MNDVKASATTSAAAAAVVPRRRRPRRPRPVPPAPTREARQRAVLILEVLAGGRTPAQAAEALTVSLTHYYLLEEKALQGLLLACEPAPRGPGTDPQRQLEALQRDCQRWQRECARQQALVRAAQRTIGLAAPAAAPAAKEGGRKRKPRRPVVRALQAASKLRGAEETGPPVSPMAAART